ncbi:MAG: SSU rRNA (adenine(1518)-N(6)/adenine(1519)-N(6))-dimethyltransferase [Candidatus Ozemobacter sibiricus]|uniref:SSU rRNA (Adenine(1518)-N(6)/adenine(1519)-N(6))-dimethyltransferase n=1 Tax=Candidatus Ozemobacter sibiricus TaxID=2268124 RepID=A0A367ZVT9_9BACT|nr:MAG: SSU rRNA (adenine(1518)-N(6)/adenine(1519)-N(6))-dimethyltransferase [Candidatus Ozemobacter sibiricus]
MARLAPTTGDEIWELGPGPGALTRLLVETGATVRAFEIDERWRPELETRFAGRATFHWGDFLELDPTPFVPASGGFLACGNLPYYCATPMIRRLLALPRRPDRLVFVIQEEVARKAIAQPGTSAYGFLSAQLQLAAEVKMGSVFPPSSFRPVPKVSSAILELRPLALPANEIARRQRALWLLSVMLRQRRKMAVNLLRRALPQVEWQSLFEQVALPAGCRGEAIPFATLLRLVDAVPADAWPPAYQAAEPDGSF